MAREQPEAFRPDLGGANLDNARLVRVSLAGANLDNANFNEARLDFARFEYANLIGSCFIGARLIGTRFDHANLEHAHLSLPPARQPHPAFLPCCRRRSSSNVDLSGCKGPGELPALGPSSSTTAPYSAPARCRSPSCAASACPTT